MQNSYTESENPFVRSPRTDRPVPMPLLSALLAVHAYSAPLAGRPAVTRAAAGSITMGGNQKVVGFDVFLSRSKLYT